MIQSMTGFGAAEEQFEDTLYEIEIRTVNNRYIKLRIKVPDCLSFLENDIDKLLRSKLGRGTVSISINMKNISSKPLLNIDKEVLRQLVGQLEEVCLNRDMKYHIDISGLLSVPGVIVPFQPAKESAERLKKFTLSLTEKAISELKQMRLIEGKSLAADVEKHCVRLRENIEQVRGRSGVVVLEYCKKLRKRVDGLLSEVKLELDEETLSREVAIFADRCDISEELSRLESHIDQFRQSSGQSGQAGRRLDFISQEMLREANTIASKSLDAEIVNIVVDMKCHIDRIKEQVQNVE